jgi:hypothetical protein
VEFTITFDRDAAIFTTAGAGTFEGFRDGIQALVDDPGFTLGMPILVDHSSLDVSGMSPNEVRAIGDFVAALGERIGPSRVAVVVPNSLTFGFVRMAETQANQPQLTVRPFYSLAEAADWLQGETSKAS